MIKAIASIIVSLALVSSQNLCDDAYGKHCPEEVGWAVGKCLSGVDVSELGADCQSFMNLHDVCKV
jgi:hypothetical protein